MRMLVTGGAGFIGANFVHYTRRDHPEHEVTVLDALTYAGNEASLAPVRDDIEFVHGSVADAALVDELVGRCDVVVHFAAESHNDNSLRRPVAVPADQHHRHVHDPRGGAEARRPAAPHLHRRGVRRPRARRPGEVHAADALQPVEPLLLDQGRLRPAGAGLGALVRHPRHDLQLLEQLRAVPARREVHPAPDHQRARPACGPSCTATGENVRDWIHVDDHNSAVHAILEKGRSGETYLIGADGEKNNREVARR